MGKKRKSKLMSIGFVLSLTVLLLIEICGGSSASGAAPSTIKIGVSNALTGIYASNGKEIQQGYKIALKHINDAGGVYIKEFNKKSPLEILFMDNESDLTKAGGRLEKLYSVDKVDVFLGGCIGALTIPQMAIAEKYRMPIIAPIMTSTAEFEKGYKYSYTPFQSEQDQANAFLDILDSIPKNQRPNRITYLGVQDEWGVATGKYLKEFAAKRNVEIVNYEMFSMAATDFSSLIINSKRAGADALFTTPSRPQGVRLVKQMKELDWSPKFSYIIRGATTSTWPQNLGKDGDYVCHTSGWSYHLKLPGVQEFDEDYRSAYGNFPEATAGVAYACVQIMADALQRAGSLDREKIRNAIAATNMMTVMGPMKFKSNGRGEGKYNQTINQWQNGKEELVWPKDQVTVPLAYPIPPWKER
jgi:branched-chain amino acid transport system substrate-binding protein